MRRVGGKKRVKRGSLVVLSSVNDHRCSLSREAAPKHGRRAARDRNRAKGGIEHEEKDARTERVTRMNGEE